MVKAHLKLPPKVWRTIITWALVSYAVQLIAMIIQGAVRYEFQMPQVVSLVIQLLIPAVAFLIGFAVSHWKKQQNHIRFAIILAISTYLWYQISQILLPYLNGIGGGRYWDSIQSYVFPAVTALVVATLIPIVILRRDTQSLESKTFIGYFGLLGIATALSLTIPVLRFAQWSMTVYNPYHTSVLHWTLALLLVGPTVFFVAIIIINYLKLHTIKSTVQRLFITSIVATYAFILLSALIAFIGILPLHNALNLWIAGVAYLAVLVTDGIIISRLRQVLSK